MNNTLKELAKIFYDNGSSLYIVGGFVRDSYLGIKNSDNIIDLCSPLRPEKTIEILSKTKFKVDYLNFELGVLVIYGENRYEFSTFRREIYSSSNSAPSVEFITDIREDAERRDFKINAIYYDIINDKYVDPLGGIFDLDNRIITTVKIPRVAFSIDPERILRLIRFAASLNFSISDDTLAVAKLNAESIEYLSRGKIRKEFLKMLYVDEIYPELESSKTAHYEAMRMLKEFNILGSLFPLLNDSFDNENLMNKFKNSSKDARLAILFFDKLNKELKKHAKEKNSTFDKEKFIDDLIEENLGKEKLNFDEEDKKLIKKIIFGYFFKKTIYVLDEDVRKFIFDNYDCIDGIIELKKLYKPSKEKPKEKEKNKKLIKLIKKTKSKMEEEKVVFDYNLLNINGKDLIRNFPKIKLELLNEFMFAIAEKLAQHENMENNEENIIAMGKKVLSERKEYFCENEIETATYKTDGKVKVFIRTATKKTNNFLKSFGRKVKCIFIAIFGKKK